MMLEQLKIVADAFWSPSRAVARAAEQRRLWLVQGLILTAFMLSTAMANRFMTGVVINGRLGVNVEAARSLAASMTVGGYFSLILGTGLQVLSWHLTAGVLLILNTLVGSFQVNYSKHLSLAVVGSIYTNIAPFHLLLVWHCRGVEAFSSLRELFVPIGLNLLPIRMSAYAWNLLGSFNPYQVCSVAYIVYGFARLTGARRLEAWCSVGGLWVLWIIVIAAVPQSNY